VDLGHVSADTVACKSFESSCTTIEEFSSMNLKFRKILKQRGFKTDQTSYYPNIAYPCGANQINYYVIDSDGDIYKCWSEIGNKSIRIGNLNNLSQRNSFELMKEINWLTWDPFDYDSCIKCKMLPICMGGCSYRAMFTNNDSPECEIWKYDLEEYIRDRYNHEKEILK